MSSAVTDEELNALEEKAVLLSGPLVPLLPPRSPTRPAARLQIQRPKSGAPPATAAAEGTHRPRLGDKHADWSCDSFVVPAAFPRSVRGSTRDPGASEHGTATQDPAGSAGRPDPRVLYRDMMAKQVEAQQKQVDVNNAPELDEQQQLHLAVNRYRPRKTRTSGDGPALTLVFGHANGFHKEIWEPTIADLLEELDGDGQTLQVEEIWSLDAVNQGDSGVLNEHVLGDTFNWADHGRDLLNFLISYLGDPSQSPDSRTETIPRVEADKQLLELSDDAPKPGPASPLERTWRNRLIVGIGHSLGGGGLAYAASTAPGLFSSVIFCDPVIIAPEVLRSVAPLTIGAIARRESWASRQDAKQGFLKKAFFRKWDARVLDLYCEHGLKDVEGGVALKCRAKDEALTFCDPQAAAARRACVRLTRVPKSLKAHFVLADHNMSVLTEPMIERLLEHVPHATTARVKGAGHLIAQEDPKQTANKIAKFLRETYPVSKASASKRGKARL